MHYADWAPRGWHQAAVFMGRLFVLGGSPLNNDVWSANVTNATGNRFSGTADAELNAGKNEREDGALQIEGEGTCVRGARFEFETEL